MTPERYQRLKTIFQGAIERPARERDAWIAEAIDGDHELEADVRRLLEAHEAADHPLDRPASEALLPAPFQAGTTVGPFRIESELGRGGMGIVYKAFDTRLQRPVALKALPGAAALDPDRRKRLRNEALLAATINHPGVATVYRLEEVDGALLLATEFIDGYPLRAAIERGPLALQRALAITRDVLAALTAAHAAGVVHRDLKPDNVMVAHGDLVKIVDFGIARSQRFALTKVTKDGAPGTPAYMAPEQLAGAEADARTDLYAVGIMLAEMVSGHHPGTPGVAPLPTQLQAVVEKSLMRDPAARFQTATEMLTALDALLQPARGGGAAVGWWRFHQIAAAVVYWLMIAPAWSARTAIGGTPGRLLFLVTLAAVVVSSILRLHQCFTSHYYAGHLPHVRSRAAMALLVADAVFVLALASAALMLGDSDSGLTALMLAVAIGAAVAALVIEPATTRAAFT